MERANCRTRKIPKMPAADGRTTPRYVFTRPRERISKKSGSIAIWTGMTMPRRRSRNNRSRPGNRSFANA